MNRIFYTLVALFILIVALNGQVVMNIFQKGGIKSQLFVNNIDSITFTGLTDTIPITEPKLPIITTKDVYSVTSFWATVEYVITDDGGAGITSHGVCWSTETEPTVNLKTKTEEGSGIGNARSHLTDLQPLTTYYARPYATNSEGTSYGNTITFTTFYSSESVTDIDGNVYQSVKIGNQIWMAENLKTTKYRDGTSIPNVTDKNQWGLMTTGAYCNYNNEISISDTYGRLYNWYTANDVRNIAPVGWHVATIAEWETLINFLGNYTVAGGKLMESGSGHWTINDIKADNETGFSALPGGIREEDGDFYGLKTQASFWSSSQFDALYGWQRAIVSSNMVVKTSARKMMGAYIRCVKD